MASNINDTLPWIEKYRPSKLDDVASHSVIIQTLRNFVKNKQLPHLLLHGPAGTGKTSTIKACARELYGENYMDLMTLEINASEERGIDIVRDRIKQFVNTAMYAPHTDDEAPRNNLYKLVILDEADAMTSDAQDMLRQVIEKYTINARFCLICNFLKKIDVALQSRCIAFRFSPLAPVDMKGCLDKVITYEHLSITPDGISTIIERSNGDMRKVLNTAQTLAQMNKTITGALVNKSLGYPSRDDIYVLLDTCLQKKLADSVTYIRTYHMDNGIAATDIITELHNILVQIMFGNVTTFDISPQKIQSILIKLRDIELYLCNSSYDQIHLDAIVAAFYDK